jgi:hypothetical protein
LLSTSSGARAEISTAATSASENFLTFEVVQTLKQRAECDIMQPDDFNPWAGM